MAPARHKWIAADTLDFFLISLSKLTKIWQCIQTIKDVALFLNFSARSAVSKKVLFLQRTPRGKQKRSSRSISLRDTLLPGSHRGHRRRGQRSQQVYPR